MTHEHDDEELLDLIMMGRLIEARAEICSNCDDPHPIFIFRTALPSGDEAFFELEIPAEPLTEDKSSFETFVDQLSTIAAMIRMQRMSKSVPPGDMN